MKVYHGSFQEISNPDLLHSRIDIDFGKGFYLTQDKFMAEKWAVGKANSVINIYDLSLDGLNVINLGLTQQWLDFVSYNRGFGGSKFNIDNIDIIIGPTADDKMFNTLSAYMAGFLSAEQTIKYLNIAGHSNQIVLKTEKALQNLSFLHSKCIFGKQKQDLLEQISLERKIANESLRIYLQKDKYSTEREVTLVDDDYDEKER